MFTRFKLTIILFCIIFLKTVKIKLKKKFDMNDKQCGETVEFKYFEILTSDHCLFIQLKMFFC